MTNLKREFRQITHNTFPAWKSDCFTSRKPFKAHGPLVELAAAALLNARRSLAREIRAKIRKESG